MQPRRGVEIAFLEKQELLLRDFGNAGRLVSRAGRLGLDRLLAPFAQRYMVLKRRTLGPGMRTDRVIGVMLARYNLTEYGAILGRTEPNEQKGVLLRSWLACSSLLKGVTGCGGLGSHIGVKEHS
jgi:hypothetical protein